MNRSTSSQTWEDRQPELERTMEPLQIDEVEKEAETHQTRLAPLLGRILLPLSVLAFGGIGFAILSVETEKEKQPAVQPRAIRTKVVELNVQDYPTIIKAHGIVRPHNEINLSARVSGRIDRISPKFEDGTFFSKGDVLVELDAEDYTTAVAMASARLLGAKANMQLAKQNHERNLEFLSEDLISEAEVDQTAATLSQAEADVDSATAQLEQANRDLERTAIRAPFNGRVRQRLVGEGQLVRADMPLGVVFDIDFAEIRLPISGSQLALLNLPESAEDPPVEVLLNDAINIENETVWRAEIIRTEGTLDEKSLELFAIAHIPDPFGRKSGEPPLRIGQPVTGSVPGHVLKDVFPVPRRAVRQLDQIFLVDKEELTLHGRTIIPLWSDEDHVVFRDPALPNGSLLATTRLVYAPEGANVEILPEANPAGTPVVQSNPKSESKGGGKNKT